MNKLTVLGVTSVPMLLILVLLIAFQPTTAQRQQPLKPAQILSIENARAVAWKPTGDVLAVGADDGIYLLREMLQAIRVIANPVQQIESLDWSPDGRYLAASSVDKWPTSAVRVWNAATGALIATFSGQSRAIPTLEWSPDGRQIASGSWDATLQIWNPFTSAILHTFSYQPDKEISNIVDQVAWSPDGARIAAFLPSRGIRIWDVEIEMLSLFIPETKAYLPVSDAVVWSPDGQYLMDGYRLLDANTGGVVREFHNCPYSFILDWHPSSQFMAIYDRIDGNDADVFICDVKSDIVIARLEGGMNVDINPPASHHNALDWNPDGKRLAGAAGDGFVRIWEVPISQS